MSVAYRAASFRTPLRPPLLPATTPARFHRGTEAEPTQYLSLHPLGPHAETLRNHDLRRPEQARALRLRTWALRVDLAPLPEIDFDTAPAYGLDPAGLVADDRTACQELADRLRAGGVPGVVVPSAALPGTRTAVLFGARVAAPYLAEPVSAIDVPASIAGEDGHPLVALLPLVRFPGDRHAGLEAWARGEPFAFAEPDWAPEAAAGP